MDAKEYVEAYGRYVNTYCAHIACNKCERTGKDCSVFSDDMVDFIEQWSKDHPVKTNMDKLQEIFGDGFTICSGFNSDNDIFVGDPVLGKTLRWEKWVQQEYKESKENKDT